jgi:hypothetical protein
MYHSDNIYEIIEQYLEGSLDDGEKLQFEQQLQVDETLKQKVLICKSTQGLIMQNKLKDLKTLMSEEKAKVEKSEMLKKTGLILLGSALLVMGGIWYLQKEKSMPRDVPQQEQRSGQEQSVLPKSPEPTEDKQIENLVPNSDKTSSKVQKPHAVEHLTAPSISTQKTASTNSKTIVTESLVVAEEEKPQVQTQEKKGEEPKVNTDNTLDACKGVVITAEITTVPPCKGLSNVGTIHLRGFRGGHGPYRVYLNGNDMGTEDSYEQLAEGNYQIMIVDAKGCKQTFNPLLLKAKDCPMDYDFNPNRGEEWLGPVLTSSAKLSILDKKGTLVHSKQVLAGEPCTWSGYSQLGTLVFGYFVFVLEKADGSVVKGSITVTE